MTLAPAREKGQLTVPTDADPGTEGRSPRSALSARQRVIVDASAIADVMMRTVTASLIGAAVAGAIVPVGRRTQIRRERDKLRFYSDLAAEQDPAKSFPAPTQLPRVSSQPARRVAERITGGTIDEIAFASGFEAVNPAMRTQWRELGRNNIVHAQHWRHADGPRPTLCAIHGYRGASYVVNGRFFAFPRHYRSGYDVLLYTLPFHGPRAEKHSPFSGYGYFAYGLTGFAEAMAHAVHDVRTIVDYLQDTGVERIALTGVSLGAYTASLVASVDNRLQAVIPICPVATPVTAFDDWFPANKVIGLGLRVSEITPAEFAGALSYHCPLNYRPLVPKDHRLIVAALGDRFAPPVQAEMLWEHWDRCGLHWFPGSHLVHVSQADYLRRMTGFLGDLMFR